MSTVVLVSCDCGSARRYASVARAELFLSRHSCDRARRERAAYERGQAREAAIDRAPKPCTHGGIHRHGNYVTFVWDRCRCIPCTTAKCAYEANRAREKARGNWQPYVDARPAAAHLRVLSAAGLGWKRVAAMAGVSSSCVYPLLYGRPDRNAGAPRTKARRALVAAILAVPMPTLDDLGATVVVDSTGGRRRLQALMTRGWSVQRIATTRGLSRKPLDHALEGGSINARTARAVVAAYEALWDQPPPQDSTGDRIAAVRARNRARAAGWAPPMAWDVDAIDDPTATPADPVPEETPGVDHAAIARALSGVPVALTRAERWIALAQLVVHGLDDHQIATRLHTTARTVLRDRQYLGIPSPRRTAA